MITSSLNPSNEGDAVTFTAVVTWNGAVQELGWLPFFADGEIIGTVDMNGAVNTFTTSALAPGTHVITSQWSLSPSNFMVYGTPIEQVVIPAPTTTTSTTTSTTLQPTTTTPVSTTSSPPDAAPTEISLTSSANPSRVGQPVTFSVSVTTGAAPAGWRTGSRSPAQVPVEGGTVTISVAGTVLATLALSAGQAVFTTSGLSAGGHTITADFSGTATAAPSSVTLLQQVDPAPAPPPRPPALPATQ